MEEKPFRSISIRASTCKLIEDFIAKNPKFVDENTEYNSIAGFLDKSARLKLHDLRNMEGCNVDVEH